MPPVVIAIDGTSGAGKGTLGKRLATHLGFSYLDTGALYRAVTFWTLLRRYDPDKPYHSVFIVKQLKTISLEPHQWGAVRLTDPGIKVTSQDISPEIRSPAVSDSVSKVARIPGVRSWVNNFIKAFVGHQPAVVDGRDIGTAVFPDAPVKFWLCVDGDEAARRRLQDASHTHTSYDEIIANLAERDKIDSTRTVAPARVASDALCIDTTHRDPDEVMEIALDHVRSRLGSPNL